MRYIETDAAKTTEYYGTVRNIPEATSAIRFAFEELSVHQLVDAQIKWMCNENFTRFRVSKDFILRDGESGAVIARYKADSEELLLNAVCPTDELVKSIFTLAFMIIRDTECNSFTVYRESWAPAKPSEKEKTFVHDAINKYNTWRKSK